MAITTLLATSNAVKISGVRFFSSFSGKPNHFLSRRWSQTTTHNKVQTSCCYRETSLKAVTPFMMPETESSSDTEGIGIVRFLKGKVISFPAQQDFLLKVKKYPNTEFSSSPSKLIFMIGNLFVAVLIRNC